LNMDCTRCSTKGCRVSEPCNDRSSEYLNEYHTEEAAATIKAASELVDNGRAGTLNRLEEIIEYAREKGYRTLGIAYCYGMEKEAGLLRNYLQRTGGFRTVMVSCTVDGVKECQVDPSKCDQSVSCNPLGQANAINHSDAEFTIMMGLCLGHDILFQKKLRTDFTTWLVKDRVTKHRPLDALPGYQSPEDLFLAEMDKGFHLINWEQMRDWISEINWQENTVLLDLRSREVFQKDGIAGSVQCLLTDLPDQYRELIPDQTKKIIVYCNGGMQSLYAVMYLRLKGYQDVSSLSGGYSNYIAKTNI